jgi:hypothetical protein
MLKVRERDTYTERIQDTRETRKQLENNNNRKVNLLFFSFFGFGIAVVLIVYAVFLSFEIFWSFDFLCIFDTQQKCVGMFQFVG